MAVMFNGRSLVTPAVETSVDDSKMFPLSNPYGNVLAIVGSALGGKPKTPLLMGSPLRAKRILRGGEGLEAVNKAFAPSSATGSPARIYFVRVDPATQSALTLVDANDDAVIELKSTDYGAHTKDIEIKIESGTSLGKKISIRILGVVNAKDNVGADPLSITYTGAEATAKVTVETGVMTMEAPSGTVVKTIQLDSYSSSSAIAEAIEAVAGWDVTVTRGQERFLPKNYDYVSGNPKAAPVKVNGHLFSVVNWINSVEEIQIDATQLTVNGLPPANIAYTQLVGGVNGNIVSTDWEDAFAALHEADVHWIVPLSDDSAIWDMTVAHCEYLSSVKKERRAFVGAGTGISNDQAVAHAMGVDSDRVAYVWPGVYEQDPVTRKLALKPAYYGAVAVAAGFSSINPGETMSRKPVHVAGAEVQLREPTDTDELLDSGVLPLVQGNAGVIISQAVSTWQLDERYNRREVSVGAAVDYVARSVRDGLVQFLGRRAAPVTVAAIRSRTDSILADLARDPTVGGLGVLVGDSESPPYRNIRVELRGDVVTVSFECQPVIPINYILIPITISPYSGTVIE